MESIERLTQAIHSDRLDLESVANVVGASAASEGIPLHEVFDHMEESYQGAEPAYRTVKAVASAWAEQMYEYLISGTCEDPLTSLATARHLRTVLGDVYREADRGGRSASDTYALVILELPVLRSRPLAVRLRALETASVMRMVFIGGETLAQTAPHRFVALATHENSGATAVKLLDMLMRRAFPQGPAARLRVEMLPANEEELAGVFSRLSR